MAERGDTCGVSEAVSRIDAQIEIVSPVIATVFAHWRDLARSANGIPLRTAISPMAMPSALPHVWLCDHEADSGRFLYRLAGEHVRASQGQQMNGRHLDEFTEAEAYPRIHSYFMRCVETPAVVHIIGRIYAEQARVASGERIMLPYARDDGSVGGILGATARQWKDQSTRRSPFPSDIRRHTYFDLTTGAREVVAFPVT